MLDSLVVALLLVVGVPDPELVGEFPCGKVKLSLLEIFHSLAVSGKGRSRSKHELQRGKRYSNGEDDPPLEEDRQDEQRENQVVADVRCPEIVLRPGSLLLHRMAVDRGDVSLAVLVEHQHPGCLRERGDVAEIGA